MKSILVPAALGCLMATGWVAPPAQAAGCLKGGAIGAAAGHVAGHHGGAGAAAGCVIGHHNANKNARKNAQPQGSSTDTRSNNSNSGH